MAIASWKNKEDPTKFDVYCLWCGKIIPKIDNEGWENHMFNKHEENLFPIPE